MRVCVSPLAGPGVWHAADDGGEHQGGDEGEEDQVNEALHPVIAQPGQRLNVVLRGHENSGLSRPERGEKFGRPVPRLTMCRLRQSTSAVSWWSPTSVEFSTDWICSRLACTQEAERLQLRASKRRRACTAAHADGR